MWWWVVIGVVFIIGPLVLAAVLHYGMGDEDRDA